MRVFMFAAAALCSSLTPGASAVPITFDDRALFEAQGSISEFQDFESFDSDEFSFPGDPFVDGSITYTSEGTNLIVGANTSITPVSNTLSYDFFDTALSGDIGGMFNMFALDMAINDVDNVSTLVSLTLFTNLSSYLFDVDLPAVQVEQFFLGFLLPDDEHFTGFMFDVANFVHIDNVTLGNAVAAVPEPPVIFLVLLGMLSLGIRQRREQMLML